MTKGHFWDIFSKMYNNLANYEENFQEFFTSCCVFLDREKQKRTITILSLSKNIVEWCNRLPIFQKTPQVHISLQSSPDYKPFQYDCEIRLPLTITCHIHCN